MQDTAFIGRQPILNQNQQIIGYELLFRHSGTAQQAVILDDFKASARVLMNTVSDFGTQWLLGDKFAFINVNEELLHSDLLHLLLPERTVLEVLETVTPSANLIAQLKTLRSQGFRIALDDYVHTPESATLLQCADYLKFDVMAQGLESCSSLIALLKAQSIKVVAEKIETHEEYERCKELGFDMFQGYYFAKPETLSAKVINPAFESVLDLLNMVYRDADTRELEIGFKRDPALSLKLLRYINSAGFGLLKKVESIRQALTMLGMKQLYRFLTLLFITANDKETAPALMKTAITRGRMTELLGDDRFDQPGRDNLFITGVFSLLDVMLDMPMEQVLEKVMLPDAINDALLQRKGPYGPYLRLAEAYESQDAAQIEQVAKTLDYAPEKANDCHFAALAWAENLGI